MTHPAVTSLHAALAALNITPSGTDSECGSCDTYFYAHLEGTDIACAVAYAGSDEPEITVDLLHPAFWPVTQVALTEHALIIGDRLLPAQAGRVRLGGGWINPRAVSAAQVSLVARALRDEASWQQHGEITYRDDTVLVGAREYSRTALLRALGASGPDRPR